MNLPIRVLIVDDHPVVRKGIKTLLGEEKDLEVVGEAVNGRDALEKVEALQPDVILMDLVMPEMSGIEAIERITAAHPEARILVMTSFAADDKVFPSIKAGALGYLLKDSDPEDLIRMIHQVARGELSIHPSIARKVIQELNRPPEEPLTPSPLTEREVEILQLLAQGVENKEIARRLVLREATVRTHVSNILGKLQLANRVQATLYALRTGLTTLDDES
ncbi:MAG: DNA-binding response regulator [Anaerolineae bacterium UTCFX2]|jgi:NarL family two-component system response regulator LiaR|nr:response regulator transcription factor [Anaerolineales bacterium]OQY87975.1 MAG: DNA-binding response regulator [Anaerolineae bacterium UTCFX2]